MWRAFILAWILAGGLRGGAPEFIDVFQPAHDGYASIRIPSVIVTKSGTVLAFAEGRQKSGDQAENDIIAKRSTDGGRTWSPVHLIHDDGANSLNNPTVVQERESGRVFLIYQRIPAHLTEKGPDIATGFDGPNVYRNFLVSSHDDGQTWTKPLDVTRTTKHPTGATTIASGPGIGIQLARGPHAGRLILPFNEGPYGQWNDYAAFSDDAGQTWACGENVPGALVTDSAGRMKSQINEVQMVEMTDGSVLLNSRQFAGAKVRKSALSHDGGQSWSPVADVPDLRDPSCMGSIIRLSFEPSRLLYSGPDSTTRENGTVHLSIDDGATWPVNRILFPGPFAYSVLTVLPDGTIGCLFEADDYKRIVFARFTLDWLTEKQL